MPERRARSCSRASRCRANSWICAPTEYCEHPEATPNAGENFTARLLAALSALPLLLAVGAVLALALAGLPKAVEVEARQDAAVNVKRVTSYDLGDYAPEATERLDLIRAFVETKTTWHPVGW